MDDEELRQSIEFLWVTRKDGLRYQVHLPGEQVDAVMTLIKQDRETERRRNEGIGAYIAISMLSRHVGYLLAHKAQGLPSMTSEVIENLWNAMKQIQSENEQYMRKQLTTNSEANHEN